VKTRRYSEVQIFRILQEVDAGSQVVDVAPGLKVSGGKVVAQAVGATTIV